MIVLQSVDQVQLYLQKMLVRTEHAVPVRQSCLKVISCAIWAKDPGTALTIREYGQTDESPDGRNPGNILWGYFGGQRLAFTYGHAAEAIEVKLGGLQGQVVQSFRDTDPPSAIYDWFLSKISHLD